MTKFLLIMLLNFLNLKAVANENMCILKKVPTTPDTMKIFDESSLKMLKLANIEMATTDMKDFCKRNLFIRYLNSKKLAPDNCTTMPLKELEQVVDKVSGNKQADSWTLSLLSTKESRRLAIDPLNEYEKSFEVPKNNSTVVAKFTINMEFSNKEDFVSAAKMDTQISLLCANENIFNVFGCKQSLKFIKANGPKGPSSLMTPNAWKMIYESNKYDEGLRLMALKMQNAVSQGDISGDANVWNDLIQVFISTGLNQSEAEEGAWNSLAIIANGGPNLQTRTMAIEGNVQKGKSLNYIAKAMGYFDYLKQEKNQPLYSYPSNIKTSCDSAKNYHFWMSAYLARELVKNDIVDVKDAIKHTLFAEKAYQLNREIGRRGKDSGLVSAVLAGESYGPIHQVVRMDLANAASGATFGARSAKKLYTGKIDQDASLVSMLQKSEPKSPINGNEPLSDLEIISHWEMVFASKAALIPLVDEK